MAKQSIQPRADQPRVTGANLAKGEKPATIKKVQGIKRVTKTTSAGIRG